MTKPHHLNIILALKYTPGIGPVKAKKLLAQDNLTDFAPTPQIREKVEEELELLARKKVLTITLLDEAYPPLLKEIANPPLLLYYEGSLGATFPLAFVGSRQAHPYAAKACAKIIGDLKGSGASIISGLAYGIDTLAHQSALENDLHTVAVLGCGIDINYPAGNERLREKILTCGGAIISEVPLGTKPAPHYFPQRNRIISGLSLATVVLQARLTSGSLITAQTALEQGRGVYALPGSIFHEDFCGNHALLREGALCIRHAEDLLEDFKPVRAKKDPMPPHTPSLPRLSEEEALIYGLIKDRA
ncbi:MAG: DNA-protecting protein DprA, partial [Spirochaetae bacterium HGW-Spirochaetae-6]